MKKILASLLIATSAGTIAPSLQRHHRNFNYALNAGNFKTIASKTYPQGTMADGLEAITKVDNNFYGVVIENDNIAFYAIVNNKMQLLTTVANSNWLQIGSVSAMVANNCIYYEFLIKTDEYRVGSGQYFKLDLTTNKVTTLGNYQLVPTTNRYMYNNSNVKTYLDKNYLIIVHSYCWYVHSSATIIKLDDDSINIKSATNNIYMSFNNGNLFFNNLDVYNVITKNTISYHDALSIRIRQMYTMNNNENYVNNFNEDGTYTINKVIISNNNLTLIPIAQNINSNPEAGYIYHEQTYFYALEYNINTNRETAKLFALNGNNLALIKTYTFPFKLDYGNVYCNFNDKYLYLNQDNLAIKINLDKLT